MSRTKLIFTTFALFTYCLISAIKKSMNSINQNNSPGAGFSARVKQLGKVLTEVENLWPEKRDLLQRWQQSLVTINELRLNFSLPVTCIGPVKSGKSTLINTLAGADLLPTGAGITTSFPTTLSAGKKFSAEIKLQPETVINEMFSRAANLLFSNETEIGERSPFASSERFQVKKLLDNYQTNGNLTRHGIFNESYRLLKNIISGTEKVSEYYIEKNLNFTIADPDNSSYRQFIRDETLSPFLSEIHIKAPLKLLPPHLSLRDLPGLDTPNPSHQSIIIQQLSESPALLYVISSRIGLRQADYQLLEHLHKLGLHERLLFVINLDLDVHADADEINSMSKRCSDELNELGFSQPKYAFSTLALFWSRQEIADKLNPTCKRRWQTWQEDPDKLKISAAGARQFLDRLLELGRNESGETLLRHSEKRLQQIHNNTRRLIESEIEQLTTPDKSLHSNVGQLRDHRDKIDAVLHETERIISGVCNEVEKFCHNQITRWLDATGDQGLRKQLEIIIANYQVPAELIPEKNRNPLTPVKIIDNHFQLTIPSQIQERTTLETIRFFKTLQLEINQHLLKGCIPLFVICENFTTDNGVDQNGLPLPVKISGEIPLFTLKSEAEERFAIVSKIQDLSQLLGRKIFRFRKRLTLSQEYALQIKKAAHKELPRWLKNYREQLKFAFIHPHIDECRKLITDFFTDFLESTQTALTHSGKIADNNREAAARRADKLKDILSHLQQE